MAQLNWKNWPDDDLEHYLHVAGQVNGLWDNLRNQLGAEQCAQLDPTLVSRASIHQAEQELKQRDHTGFNQDPGYERGKEARLKILRCIEQFIELHHHAPSIKEIQQQAQISSSSLCQWHIDKLVKTGFLSKTPGVYRSLRVIRPSLYLEQQLKNKESTMA